MSKRQEPESQIDIAIYLRMVRRNIWIIALLAILGAGVGTYVAKTTEPIYNATAPTLLMISDQILKFSVSCVVDGFRPTKTFNNSDVPAFLILSNQTGVSDPGGILLKPSKSWKR